MDRWERADEVVAKVEHTLLVAFLSFMIVLAFLQILLRTGSGDTQLYLLSLG